MQNRHNLSKLALIILSLGLSFFLGYKYDAVNNSKNTPQAKNIPSATPVSVKELTLARTDTVVIGVSKTDQTQIENLVDQFEEYKNRKDVNNILASFTPPANKQEQSDLDFIEGKDLPGPPLSRLFTTQGYNLVTSAYFIRKIEQSPDPNKITVSIDELRINYEGLVDNGGSIGYVAQIANLIAEFQKTVQGYKLASYYHQKPNNGISKYEGFYAY